MTTALGGGEGSTPRPGRFTPGKDPVPIVQEAGWAPGPVWTGAENLAPTGFDPRTVQPVVSYYTDYATRPTDVYLYPFFNLSARCGWVVNARPRPPFPLGKTRYPSYRRLGGPQGRSGRLRIISLPRDSIPGPSSPQRVAVPTELSRPTSVFGAAVIVRVGRLGYRGSVSDRDKYCVL